MIDNSDNIEDLLGMEVKAKEYSKDTKLGAFEEKYRVKVLDYVQEDTGKDNLSMVNLSSFYKDHIDIEELKEDMKEVIASLETNFDDGFYILEETKALNMLHIRFGTMVNYDFQQSKCLLNELQQPFKMYWEDDIKGNLEVTAFEEIEKKLIKENAKSMDAFREFVDNYTKGDYEELTAAEYEEQKESIESEIKEKKNLIHEAFDKKEELEFFYTEDELGFNEYLEDDGIDDIIVYSMKVDFENKTINTYLNDTKAQTMEFNTLTELVSEIKSYQDDDFSRAEDLSAIEENLKDSIRDQISLQAIEKFLSEGYSEEEIEEIFNELDIELPEEYEKSKKVEVEKTR